MTLNPIILILKTAAKLVSFLLYFLTIASAFGGYIPPRIWALPSGLVLFFPYLYIATFIVGLLWLLWKKILPTVGAAITLIICFSSAMVVTPLKGSKGASNLDKTFSLMTYNTFGFKDLQNDSINYSRGLAYIIAANADIVCLQEIYGLNIPNPTSKINEQLDSIKRMYPFVLSAPTSANTILSKFPAVEDTLPSDMQSFCSLAHIKIGNERVDVINVHLASYRFSDADRNVVSGIHNLNTAKESVSEFRHSIWHKMGIAFQERASNAEILRNYLNNSDVAPTTIICGDFNDVPLSWCYNKVKGSDFNDAYSLTGFGPIITYNSHFFYFHIDQILYRGNLNALKVWRGKLKSSDHYPVEALFEFNSPQQ